MIAAHRNRQTAFRMAFSIQPVWDALLAAENKRRLRTTERLKMMQLEWQAEGQKDKKSARGEPKLKRGRAKTKPEPTVNDALNVLGYRTDKAIWEVRNKYI